MPKAVGFIEAGISVALAIPTGGASLGLSAILSSTALYAAKFGLSTAITAGLDAFFAPKPPTPEAGKATFRMARPPKQRGYGQYRVSGPAVLYESFADTLFQINAINDGKIQSFDHYFLNDDEVAFGASDAFNQFEVQPYPNGRYPTGHVIFAFRLGLDPETLYGGPNSVIAGQWPTTSLGNGVASFLLSCTGSSAALQNQAFPFGTPDPNVVVTGSVVWDWRNPDQAQSDYHTWAGSLNPVVNLVDWLTSAQGTQGITTGLGFSFETVIAPQLDMWTAAADVCDEAIVVINWNSFCVVGSQGTLNDESHGGTQPAVDFIVIDGASGIVAGTNIYTGLENLDVVSVTPPGDASPLGYTVTFNRLITFTYLKGQYVQWQVLDGSATQPRYQMGGYYTYDNDPADVLTKLLQTFDGWISTNTQGQLLIYAGQYYAPGASQIVPPEAVVGYEIKPYLEDELAVNVFLLAFNDPSHEWTMTDTNPWFDDADIAARGVERSQDMKLEWVHYNSQARRLAKRAMSRLTLPTGSITMNLAGIAFLGFRYLQVNVEELVSLTNVVIEIRKVRLELQRLQVTFDFVIADPNIDDWDPAVEELNGPQVNSRLTSVPNTPPTIISATPSYVQSTGEGTGAVVDIVAESPLGSGYDWVAQVSPHGENAWIPWTFNSVNSDSAGDVILTTGFVPVGSVDVQVAYATGGSLSPWSPIVTTTVSPPSAGSIVATASENIPAGALVTVSGSSPTMTLASAAAGGSAATGFVLAAVPMGDTGTVYFSGLDSTIAAPVSWPTAWLSPTTPGGYVGVEPSGAGVITQTVGVAILGVGLVFQPGVPSGLPALLVTEGGVQITTEGGTPLERETP